jgi:hypothetical protein
MKVGELRSVVARVEICIQVPINWSARREERRGGERTGHVSLANLKVPMYKSSDMESAGTSEADLAYRGGETKWKPLSAGFAPLHLKARRPWKQRVFRAYVR